MFGQLAFVIGLQGLLVRRQRRPLRVVDQVQAEARARYTITQRVQLLQGHNAFVKHTITALFVHIGGGITGHRRHDVHLVFGQKRSQAFLPLLQQNRQVAAVDHAHTHGAGRHHQVTEAPVQLRRPASQIQGLYLTRLQHLRNQGQRGLVHHLGSVGAGVDMAMQATLVAFVAQVDLQGLQGSALDGRELGLLQQWECVVHGVCFLKKSRQII